MFNNVNRLNHSSSTKNTATNEIKHFPQLFALGLQIRLKQKLHHFLPWSTISTKLDIDAYKCKDANIFNFKSLVQLTCLVIKNI